MIGKTCGVRMFKGPCRNGCNFGCDDCRIGCFNPARYRNPFFGKDFYEDRHWWRGGYSYAEYLCAECYDYMVGDAKEMEAVFRDEEGYVENPEYTKLLEQL